MNFPQYLENKFLEWQQSRGGRKTVREFAVYIGVSAASITQWWKGKRSPEGENVQKLAQKLGIEVYDVLGLPRPDPDLLYIQKHWEDLDPETRRLLREQAEKYKQINLEVKSELARAHQKRKPRTAG